MSGEKMSIYDPSKQLVVDICRTLVNRGYLKTAEGNISLRIPGQPAFAITPSSYDYAKMQAQDICVLTMETDRLEGEMKPSIESGMHAAVYQSRADVQAILHTHQVYASALAIIHAPIPGLFDEQVRFLGRSVEIIPYAPSGTAFLKNNVRRKIKTSSNAFILQNHGVLIFGGNAERAIANMALLEKCALAYLLALCTERKVTKIPLAVREITLAKLREDEKKYAQPE
jgi:ribulose-5-phosphate 4-epimerase/fuculose-1-phosphate aldolase